MRGDDFVLTMETGGSPFAAAIWTRAIASLAARSIPVGSRLELTGVWSIETDENRDRRHFACCFVLSADIAVIERPSWWTLHQSHPSSFALAVDDPPWYYMDRRAYVTV